MKPPHVLIVDDEEFVRDSLEEILRHEGLATSAAAGAQEAVRFLETRECDAIVTDLRMPRGDGLSLLAEARRRGVSIPIVMITGVGTVGEAVQAMKAGAFDFLQKPVHPAELVRVVKRAVEHHALQREVQLLRGSVASLRRAEALIGESAPLRALREQLERLASTDSTVLITGETGTGKELCAREIHDHGARAPRLLVRLDCARSSGSAEQLAARLAEAEGGTLLLDDVGTLRAEAQSPLARLLERGEYQDERGRTRTADLRVIATTSEDLAARVRAGTFGAELFHRLEVVPLRLPPLREHLEDIPAIAAHHLQHAKSGGKARTLSPEAVEVLASHEWPGNVRELRNVLERALIVAGAAELSADVFRSILEPVMAQPPARAPDSSLARLTEFNLRRNVDLRERETVLSALQRCRGVKKEACDLLGIDPRNLGYYLRKHKLKESEWNPA
ncbi:MAG: sigma-54-dependent Fis family transcriptional regulator [Planctomycetes bacterium]|nr:sigma-54-dependent Fis family transcriptional regulator [Planctomycetota bacterium]